MVVSFSMHAAEAKEILNSTSNSSNESHHNQQLPLEVSPSSSTSTTTTDRTKINGYVPYEQWHCGASSFDKTLSHQIAEADCPARMYEANLCCHVHDLCYMEDKTQEHCDSEFCFCLERLLAEASRRANESNAGSCASVSSSFCGIVQIFGSMAHANAQQQRKASQNAPITTTGLPTTASTSYNEIEPVPIPTEYIAIIIVGALLLVIVIGVSALICSRVLRMRERRPSKIVSYENRLNSDKPMKVLQISLFGKTVSVPPSGKRRFLNNSGLSGLSSRGNSAKNHLEFTPSSSDMSLLEHSDRISSNSSVSRQTEKDPHLYLLSPFDKQMQYI